jgi:TetR/AcrR family transcriptional regulator, transcriptional repressor for nem operon
MDTSDRLIESTRALLWERGYVGTSPKAIQQHAGVGQGSMYHHFSGKPELALAAINRTADEMRAGIDALFAGPGTALDRVTAYLRRERDVLKGCPIGSLTQDPDVMADPELRRPVAETLAWLRGRLVGVLNEGRRNGEFGGRPGGGLDPVTTAATIVAVLQGGYVVTRAAGTTEPFNDAVEGLIALLDSFSSQGEAHVREAV